MPNDTKEIRVLPVLALRGLVLFPGMMLHFDVGRPKSVAALNQAVAADQTIFLTAQQDIREDDPAPQGLYQIGCLARVRQVLKLPGDTLRVLVEGLQRAVCLEMLRTEPGMLGQIAPCKQMPVRTSASYQEALLRHARSLFEQYAALAPKLPPDVSVAVLSAEEPGQLADYLAANLAIPMEDKQAVLEELHPVRRLEKLVQVLTKECEVLALDMEIAEKVKGQMEDNQRDYYLREQLKAVSEELNDGDNPAEEAEVYKEKINALKAPDEIKEKLCKEADKLARMPMGSHEATVVRGYLDTCLELPWGVYTKDKIDIEKARKQLDKDHYGLEKVKERILEQLSVFALKPDITGQIICLVGPPGVGKTSIAKSIAACMGRKYARLSLGGVSDEAEIRGHRKTYIGAMPGRIINAIRQAGSSNPLLLLDEVDKLGRDYRGDPSAALLEALDAEQNYAFRDHYIELPFDLSRVLFLTTANTLDTIPGPLLDRMEVIELPSYTREDKFQIARRHLVKKQLEKHGLTAATCRIADSTLYSLIDNYTREAGVRKLERAIASLCRKAAKRLASGEKKVSIKASDLKELLGPAKYRPEQILREDQVGVINGLAWTSVGGELMQLEVAALEGTGKVSLTGSLGDVMKESAQTAVSYVRSKASSLGIPADFYKNKDIHVHATEAAVPKDGPSAGVTITTALVSALTGIPVRRDVAMTGEVTLRGRVLAIGGLKEKSMAAYRAGVKTVFIPAENEPDLAELDQKVKEHICFVPVEDVGTVIRKALVTPPKPLPPAGCTPTPPLDKPAEPAAKGISQ
ncbi:MAG TPA: endopeptidase La [Firmicutes bacterium]|nr:endopeptidase La [Bacillota bacterium]